MAAPPDAPHLRYESSGLAGKLEEDAYEAYFGKPVSDPSQREALCHGADSNDMVRSCETVAGWFQPSADMHRYLAEHPEAYEQLRPRLILLAGSFNPSVAEAARSAGSGGGEAFGAGRTDSGVRHRAFEKLPVFAEPPSKDVDGRTMPAGVEAWIHESRLHNPAGVEPLAFSPDGKVLAGCIREQVCLWSTQTGELIDKVPVPPEVSSIWPDHSFLFMPTRDTFIVREPDDSSRGYVWLWRAGQGHARQLAGGKYPCHGAAVAPARGLAAVVGPYGDLAIYDAANPEASARTIQLARPPPSDLWWQYYPAFSPSGKLLAVSEPGEILRVYDVDSGKKVSEALAVGRVVGFADEDTVLAWVWCDGAQDNWRLDGVGGFDARSGKPTVQHKVDASLGDDLACLQNNVLVHLRLGGKARVAVTGWPDFKPLMATIDMGQKGGGGDSYSALSADGRLLALGGRTTVMLWDVKSGKRLFASDHPESPVDICGEGRSRGLCLLHGGRLEEWDAYKGRKLASLLPEGEHSPPRAYLRGRTSSPPSPRRVGKASRAAARSPRVGNSSFGTWTASCFGRRRSPPAGR